MRYQLVIQFQAASLDEFDHLILFENAIAEELENNAIVDGHDFGLGKMNIFILTDEPDTTFQEIQEVVSKFHLRKSMRVAYRDLAEEDFVILWPPNQKEFDII